MSKVYECLTDFFGDSNFRIVDYDVVGNVARTWCKHEYEGDVYVNLICKDGNVDVLSYSV